MPLSEEKNQSSPLAPLAPLAPLRQQADEAKTKRKKYIGEMEYKSNKQYFSFQKFWDARLKYKAYIALIAASISCSLIGGVYELIHYGVPKVAIGISTLFILPLAGLSHMIDEATFRLQKKNEYNAVKLSDLIGNNIEIPGTHVNFKSFGYVIRRVATIGLGIAAGVGLAGALFGLTLTSFGTGAVLMLGFSSAFLRIYGSYKLYTQQLKTKDFLEHKFKKYNEENLSQTDAEYENNKLRLLDELGYQRESFFSLKKFWQAPFYNKMYRVVSVVGLVAAVALAAYFVIPAAGVAAALLVAGLLGVAILGLSRETENNATTLARENEYSAQFLSLKEAPRTHEGAKASSSRLKRMGELMICVAGFVGIAVGAHLLALSLPAVGALIGVGLIGAVVRHYGARSQLKDQEDTREYIQSKSGMFHNRQQHRADVDPQGFGHGQGEGVGQYSSF